MAVGICLFSYKKFSLGRVRRSLVQSAFQFISKVFAGVEVYTGLCLCAGHSNSSTLSLVNLEAAQRYCYTGTGFGPFNSSDGKTATVNKDICVLLTLWH